MSMAMHSCPVCVLRFPSLPEVRRHVRMVHNLACPVCGKTDFSSDYQLRVHVRVFHPGCARCSFRASSKEDIEKHRSGCNNKQPDLSKVSAEQSRLRSRLGELRQRRCGDWREPILLVKRSKGNSSKKSQNVDDKENMASSKANEKRLSFEFVCDVCAFRSDSSSAMDAHLLVMHADLAEPVDHQFIRVINSEQMESTTVPIVATTKSTEISLSRDTMNTNSTTITTTTTSDGLAALISTSAGSHGSTSSSIGDQLASKTIVPDSIASPSITVTTTTSVTSMAKKTTSVTPTTTATTSTTLSLASSRMRIPSSSESSFTVSKSPVISTSNASSTTMLKHITESRVAPATFSLTSSSSTTSLMPPTSLSSRAVASTTNCSTMNSSKTATSSSSTSLEKSGSIEPSSTNKVASLASPNETVTANLSTPKEGVNTHVRKSFRCAICGFRAADRLAIRKHATSNHTAAQIVRAARQKEAITPN